MIAKMLSSSAELKHLSSLGNLWRFSTAKLEARGARCCKHVVRRQTSARPGNAEGGTATNMAVITKRDGSIREKAKGLSIQEASSYSVLNLNPTGTATRRSCEVAVGRWVDST
eukprot:2899824-Pleurochrysis_carterae.AAC.1